MTDGSTSRQPLARDEVRFRLVRDALDRAHLDAVICRLSSNVLMLTGYPSPLGRAFALFPLAGGPALLVPTDELSAARQSWVVKVQSFDVSPTARLVAAAESKLAALVRRLALEGRRVGFEGNAELLAPTYTQSSGVDNETIEMYRRVFANCKLVDATAALGEAAAVKTLREIERIGWVCEIASFAFLRAREAIRPGVTEGEVAGATAAAVLERGFGYRGIDHVFPYPRVLAGERTLDACNLNADTAGREIRRGDPVVVILALNADGFAVEIVRTFFVGPVTPRQRTVYQACLQAQRAAIAGIRDGVRAADIATRVERTFTDQGLGEARCSWYGHGVGFQAIAPDRVPRLTTESPDLLAAGMTHTLDLAVILPDVGGIRIADVIVVQPLGAEILSRIERSLEWISG